jgi:hypothetical protein
MLPQDLVRSRVSTRVSRVHGCQMSAKARGKKGGCALFGSRCEWEHGLWFFLRSRAHFHHLPLGEELGRDLCG